MFVIEDNYEFAHVVYSLWHAKIHDFEVSLFHSHDVPRGLYGTVSVLTTS